ncbi:hypothetical protein WICPIJ_001804 [Wickerhamomyces pijperi]|uniref:DNA-directed RNA polymerase III subunit n=1 Tax=Wickerhamomyces pijperi TaxID=599730 RepID=A0A9P8QCZ5_WICPI|nr:hypothetical protein WICPIJ_001804 [Wickerhamomyces pijperi]
MSFRGGRPGAPVKQHLPFGLEYSDIHSLTKDTETPVIPLPVNGTLTSIEKIVARRFINFGNLVRDGAFYTGSSLEFEQSKEKEKGGAAVKKIEIDEDGVNDGLKRYSDRYLKKRKIGPSVDDHPYNVGFFPEELYKVMGLDVKKRKKLRVTGLKTKDGLLGELQSEEGQKALLERLKQSLADDDDKEDEKEKDGKAAVEDEEENMDDEFDDEDDDDDYNAEKYFDDGEDFGDLDDFDEEAAF